MKYIDKYNCLLEGKDGSGDALWRTSLAWIAYPSAVWPEEGMRECFKSKYKRHPEWKIDDCSRDQIIMAIVASRINMRFGSLSPSFQPKIKYRISKKFTMGDSWLWYKALDGHQIAGWLFKAWSILAVWTYPQYSVHLWSWQIYTLPGKHPLMNFIGKLMCDRNNFLIRKLHGAEVTDLNIHWYKPMNDLRWQRRLGKPPRGVVLFETPNEDYKLDKDLLIQLCNESE